MRTGHNDQLTYMLLAIHIHIVLTFENNKTQKINYNERMKDVV